GEDHDRSVCQQGVFDRAVAAIKAAKARGFRVNINCTLFNTADPQRAAAFFDYVREIGVDAITVSPGYAYERAPDQQHFLDRETTKRLFRDIFRRERGGRALSVDPSRPFLRLLSHTTGYPTTSLPQH